MQDRQTIYVGGRWVPPHTGDRTPVVNPATEQVIGHVPAGDAIDVAAAVAAARAAFDGWAATDPAQRRRHLAAVRDALADRQDELAATITAEMGAPARLAGGLQTNLPLQVLDALLELLAEPVAWGAEPEQVGHSRVIREPVGVVAAITPWNYPLHQAMAKIAPALAAGCTVVHKPSELTPLTSYLIAEALEAAGLPPGVYNLVPGTGTGAGEPLVAHPDVDMVSFTGSTRAGRRIGAVAAETVKRVTLELGGKSANVLLPDADLTVAVKAGVANCYLNGGQTCTALTRMLVHGSQYDEALQRAVDYAARYQPGDPSDPQTRLGPLVSAGQRERVRQLLRQAVDEGARVLTGGPDAKDLPSPGYYVAPTVLADVAPDSVAAQEEFFGPVLSILPYTDVDDAVRLANQSSYGLAAGVWSSDVDRALAVAGRIRAGQVDINGAAFNPLAPFGGFKQSGHGREFGRYGVAEFQELKSVQVP